MYKLDSLKIPIQVDSKLHCKTRQKHRVSHVDYGRIVVMSLNTWYTRFYWLTVFSFLFSFSTRTAFIPCLSPSEIKAAINKSSTDTITYGKYIKHRLKYVDRLHSYWPLWSYLQLDKKPSKHTQAFGEKGKVILCVNFQQRQN